MKTMKTNVKAIHLSLGSTSADSVDKRNQITKR